MKKIFSILLTVLLLGSFAFATELSPAQVGEEISDFEASLLDGSTFKLSEHRGKVVMVNVWATWCPPCVGEMPDLEKLSQDYADQLVILGLNCGEAKATVADFIEENGYTYPIALDEQYELNMSLFYTDAIPYTVIINPEGVVTQTHLGMADYATFESYILEALGDSAGQEQAGEEAAEQAA